MKPISLLPMAIGWAAVTGSAFLHAEAAPIQAPDSSSLTVAERFRQPPADTRILKIIHGWPDAPPAQDDLMARLGQQGFGGVVCNVSFQDYLQSEAKWQAFTRAVREAKNRGMALWLYDEKGYPSGSAGGGVLRDHPEWEALGLLIADQETDNAPVSLAMPPGRRVLAAAFPVRQGQLDLTGQVEVSGQIRAGQLNWRPPSGRWRVMLVTESRLYEGTHAELNLAEKQPYPNLLLAEPTARFLELTHQQYARKLGDDLGQWFMATFTDEPSLMSLFLRRMPYRVVPWSESLPREFAKRRGYALEPWIPSLVAETGSGGPRARHDFWLTVGELVSTNFFGQIQEWCGRHQIPSGGHLLSEEGLLSHVAFYGDFFRCVRRLDAPSIDCLTSLPPDVPWYIARLISSAAELEGKTLTMCETSDHSQVYRPPGDTRARRTVSEAEIRGTCNRLLVSGINTITSYYSFNSLADEALQRLNAWVGRCATVLRAGYQVADIAVVYPIESVWVQFVPARHWANDSPPAARIESAYRSAADSLFKSQRDFTFVDSRALVDSRVEPGVLRHGQLGWRVVVLPAVDTLPLTAWERLADFVQRGGVVIALGALPRNSEREFPCPRVEALSRQIFGVAPNQPGVLANAQGGAGIFLPAGCEGLLPEILDRVLEAELKTVAGAPLRLTHRRGHAADTYFLINDSLEPWSGRIRLPATANGEGWDPATGKITAIDQDHDIPLALDGYGAMIFRFPSVRQSKRLPVNSQALPNLNLRDLPATKPVIARGEFVRETTRSDVDHERDAKPVWQVTGAITKGQVDTFLFVRLPFRQNVDLRPAVCLALDTWIPEGQRTSAQLLVVVKEQGGAEYLANTGRSLGIPGYVRTFLSLDQFQLAGWSNDSNQRLDLAAIQEIRIGWGGYYGNEGETVAFSWAAPRLLVR